jgi:hypothetical protein
VQNFGRSWRELILDPEITSSSILDETTRKANDEASDAEGEKRQLYGAGGADNKERKKEREKEEERREKGEKKKGRRERKEENKLLDAFNGYVFSHLIC